MNYKNLIKTVVFGAFIVMNSTEAGNLYFYDGVVFNNFSNKGEAVSSFNNENCIIIEKDLEFSELQTVKKNNPNVDVIAILTNDHINYQYSCLHYKDADFDTIVVNKNINKDIPIKDKKHLKTIFQNLFASIE